MEKNIMCISSIRTARVMPQEAYQFSLINYLSFGRTPGFISGVFLIYFIEIMLLSYSSYSVKDNRIGV